MQDACATRAVQYMCYHVLSTYRSVQYTRSEIEFAAATQLSVTFYPVRVLPFYSTAQRTV